jgi:hypothetical protein
MPSSRPRAPWRGGDFLPYADTWLAAACRERGLVVVAQAPGPELRSTFHELVGRPFPLLLVTWRDPLARGEEREAAHLAHPAPHTLSVQPLSDDALEQILAEPPLESRVRAEVLERAEGCESFARQLLRHHVERGTLVRSTQGLGVRLGMRRQLDVPVHPRWAGRVAWLQQERASAMGALEVAAAALGPVPRPALSRIVGGEAPCAALLEEGWLTERGEGRVDVRAPGLRWAVLQACHDPVSAGLVAAELVDGDAEPGRKGTVLAEAGAVEAALPLLLEGARRAVTEGFAARGLLLLHRWEVALRQLGVPPDDPRWAEGRVVREHLGRRYSGGA